MVAYKGLKMRGLLLSVNAILSVQNKYLRTEKLQIMKVTTALHCLNELAHFFTLWAGARALLFILSAVPRGRF